MNRRGMRFVEIERMLEKEKSEEDELDFMDFRDDFKYV